MPALPTLGPRISFVVIALTFALMTTGGTIPIPLYTLWGEQLDFGAATTTWVFAVYVFGTLMALVVFGGLSDQVGRRPLALVALGAAFVSTLLFILAGNVAMLLIARFLSGISVGLITSAATAALAEVYRGDNQAFPAMISTAANMGGLGMGPLLAGATAQHLPHPTTTVFVLFISLVVLTTALTFFIPETSTRRRRGPIDWTPHVGVPAEARRVYVRSAIAAVPTFTLLGFFSSLTPRFIRDTLDIDDLLIAGAATFVLFQVGVVAQLTLRSRPPRWNVLIGLPLLVVAMALVLGGFLQPSTWVFGLGAVVGGVGAGMTLMGGLRQLVQRLPHSSHAQGVASFFIAAQASLAVPVLMIGGLTSVVSLETATVAVVALVVAVASLAFVMNLRFHLAAGEQPNPERR
ncbi:MULTISPECIES: MFS transporter [Actinomycetes]